MRKLHVSIYEWFRSQGFSHYYSYSKANQAVGKQAISWRNSQTKPTVGY